MSNVDSETAKRLREEWTKVKSLQGVTATEVEDPLGKDGIVTVVSNGFRHTGAGEVTLRKGNPPEDHRYTRFRSWGPNGDDFIEKTSYLVKKNGEREFHKRRAEPNDVVFVADAMDNDDQVWTHSLT